MSIPVHTPVASLRVFLESIVDYAGLFPPASLEMRECVANYAQYLAGPHGWALGRFIVPASRLQEFAEARAAVPGGQWRISATISGDIAAELDLVEQFNARSKNAAADCVELRVSAVREVDRACALRPCGIAIFFEIAPERAAELLPFLSHSGAHAKLRTGGVVESAFPELERVTDFIACCAELGLAFKATAGLHHPLRCVRALTYEPESPTGAMHGFLNLFTAAAMAWSAVLAGREVPRETLATCLADSDFSDWHFEDDGLTWSGDEEPVRFDLGELRAVRQRFALSFGSCSFQEPIEELHEMNLL
jgi:hypothetical protein